MAAATCNIHLVHLFVTSILASLLLQGFLVESFALNGRKWRSKTYFPPSQLFPSSSFTTWSMRTLFMATTSEDEGKESSTTTDTVSTTVDPDTSVKDTESAPAPTPAPTPVASRQPPQLTPRDMMQAMGTSPRRIALGLISGTGIALAGNLFGVTSRLLTAVDEETVEATGLDTYFPRGNFKRFRTPDYTFILPAAWVADTAVELAKAQQLTRSLDYSMRKSSGGVLPDAAFGPPGRLDSRGVSQGDTNVSVIRTDLGRGFSLPAIMKSPTEGASVLLDKFLAPEGSGRNATLLEASEEGGLYQFSYTVERSTGPPNLQAISILAQKGGVLFTLTVVAPEQDWSGEFGATLKKIASSFHLR